MATDFTEANRKAFDLYAEEYNVHPWQQQIAKQILEGLQSRRDWLGVRWHKDGETRQVKLLDYACGPGAASIALQPLVTELRGMDLSEGMVKKYNEAMAQLGLSRQQAHAVVRDLVTDSDEQHEALFDAAIVSLALHHVKDPGLLIKQLAHHVKPETGVVIVIDFLPFEHGHHGHHGHGGHKDGHGPRDMIAAMAHTITQHGFDEEGMEKLFSQAGMTEIGFQVENHPTIMGDEERDNNKRHMFFARAKRAS